VNFFLLCIVFLFSQVPTQVLASTKMMLVHEL
jgi:hypothetical protein